MKNVQKYDFTKNSSKVVRQTMLKFKNVLKKITTYRKNLKICRILQMISEKPY